MKVVVSLFLVYFFLFYFILFFLILLFSRKFVFNAAFKLLYELETFFYFYFFFIAVDSVLFYVLAIYGLFDMIGRKTFLRWIANAMIRNSKKKFKLTLSTLFFTESVTRHSIPKMQSKCKFPQLSRCRQRFGRIVIH